METNFAKLTRESNNTEMGRENKESKRWSNSVLSCLLLAGKLGSMRSEFCAPEDGAPITAGDEHCLQAISCHHSGLLLTCPLAQWPTSYV